MPGILQSIGVQAQSLNAQSNAINTTGKNLANINNPNYSRERVNLVSTTDGGAVVTSVSSARNQILDSQIMQQLSSQGSLNGQQDIATTIQSFLGERINTAADSSQAASGSSANSSQSGLSSALDNFFNAFGQLASDPSQSSYKQAAISAAQNLATQLNSLNKSVSQTSASVTAQIGTQTQQAQGYLQTTADLNGQIAKIEVNAPGSALDLRDQRQAALEKLSSLMNVSVANSPEGLGQVNVTTTDAAGNTVSLVNDTKTQGALSYAAGTFTAGNPATPIVVSGGSLAGYNAASTGTLATLSANLDDISNQLVTSVNAAYGGNFFVPAGTTSGTIAVSNAINTSNLKTGASGDPGANDIATAISNLANTTFVTANGDKISGTLSDYYNSQVVTTIGQKISSLTSQQDTNTLVYNNLISQRQTESGVSTDEEASNLMVFQQSYQGIARVISVMDTLLQTLVTGL